MIDIAGHISGFYEWSVVAAGFGIDSVCLYLAWMTFDAARRLQLRNGRLRSDLAVLAFLLASALKNASLLVDAWDVELRVNTFYAIFALCQLLASLYMARRWMAERRSLKQRQQQQGLIMKQRANDFRQETS